MPTISINLDLIDSTMDKLSNQLDKSSIKNENEFGFKTPPRNQNKGKPFPPSIKQEYNEAKEARLKRRRSVLANLNELGNLSSDENNSPKIIRLNFPIISNE
jgi:hypothetical protein